MTISKRPLLTHASAAISAAIITFAIVSPAQPANTLTSATNDCLTPTASVSTPTNTLPSTPTQLPIQTPVDHGVCAPLLSIATYKPYVNLWVRNQPNTTATRLFIVSANIERRVYCRTKASNGDVWLAIKADLTQWVAYKLPDQRLEDFGTCANCD